MRLPMKKGIVLTLALTFLAILLCAATQTDLQKKKLKGPVYKITDDSEITYFNEAGNLDCISYDDGTYWGDIYYTYNDKGQLTMYEEEDYDEGFMGGTYYTYDEKGQLTEEKSEDWVGDDKTTYSYNDKGQKTWRKYFGDGTKLTSAVEYAYDKQGNISKESRYDWDMKLTKYSELVYDKNNNIVERREYVAPSTLESKTVSKYNALNQLIEESGYLPNSLTYTRKLSYDAQGSVIEETHFDAKTNTTIKTTYKYTYDSQGNWTAKEKTADGEPNYEFTRGIEYFKD